MVEPGKSVGIFSKPESSENEENTDDPNTTNEEANLHAPNNNFHDEININATY